ncbi:hypothetical protein ACIQGZ_07885 [Streptomyces sp. NPDC092296]|uniref:hypothetical protein n=1 Tax=Streptomyces sp. NPDC092296 TaxID=3366012 RepID=UPI0038212A41
MTLWPLPRAVRAAVFAAVCVALAAAAHLGMSPQTLPPGVLAVGFAATAGGSWLLAGRRRGAAATGGWMVAAQGGLHLLFAALGHGEAVAAGSDGHRMPGMADLADMPGMAGMQHSVSGQGHAAMSWWMLGAHLLAALGCALLMRHGEAALTCVFDGLRALASAVLPALPVLGARKPQRAWGTGQRGVRPPRLVFLSHALVRRGPPLPGRAY